MSLWTYDPDVDTGPVSDYFTNTFVFLLSGGGTSNTSGHAGSKGLKGASTASAIFHVEAAQHGPGGRIEFDFNPGPDTNVGQFFGIGGNDDLTHQAFTLSVDGSGAVTLSAGGEVVPSADGVVAADTLKRWRIDYSITSAAGAHDGYVIVSIDGVPVTSLMGSALIVTTGLDAVSHWGDWNFFELIFDNADVVFDRFDWREASVVAVPGVEHEFENATLTIGLTWIIVTLRSGAQHVWSDRPLPDPSTYYLGWKAPRVTQWGKIRRALSGFDGQYETSDFTVLLDDTDRFLRQLDLDKELINATVAVYMISDEGRRALEVAKTVYRGVIRDISPQGTLAYRLTIKDSFEQNFAIHNDLAQVPERVVTTSDFPKCSQTEIPSSAENYVVDGAVAAGQTKVPVRDGWGLFAERDKVHFGTDANVYGIESMSSCFVTAGSDVETYIIVTPALVTGVSDGDIVVQVPNHEIEPSVGKAVPIVYGYITDRAFIPITDPSSTYGIPPVPLNFMNQVADGLGTMVAGTRCNAVVTAIVGGREGPINGFFGNVVDPGNASSQVNFDGIAEADSYRIYFYDGVGYDPHGSAYDSTIVRVLTHDNSTLDGAFGAQFSVLFHGFGDGVDVTNDPPRNVQVGAGPMMYVGDRVLGDGKTYAEFLWAGHACYSPNGMPFQDLHLWDAAVFGSLSADIATLVIEAGIGGRLVVPGFGNWVDLGFTDSFVDYNGRRYTVLFMRGVFRDWALGVREPPANLDGVPFSVSAYGCEDVGDGSGALITHGLQQYKHIVKNWIRPVGETYQSGAWLESPTFPDDTALSMIDEDSFDIADAQSQVYVNPDGFQGNFIIGANDEAIPRRDLIARLNVSFCVDCGFNRKTQFFVVMIKTDLGPEDLKPALTYVRDIFSGTWAIDSVVRELYTAIPYRHTQDYLGRIKDGWRSVLNEILETENVANSVAYGAKSSSPLMEFYMLRGKNRESDPDEYLVGSYTIAAVLALKLARSSTLPHVPKWQTGPAGFNYELGDIVPVTHYEGLSSAGWSDRPLRLERTETDPTNYTESVESLDITPMLIFDPEDIPVTGPVDFPVEGYGGIEMPATVVEGAGSP